jgi:hypothetical protein
MTQGNDIFYTIGQAAGTLFAALVGAGIMVFFALLLFAGIKWAWSLL